MKKISRREILKKGIPAALGVFAIPTLIPSTAFGANDRLRVAIIGVNGRGKDHIQGFMKLANVEVATLCDVDNVVSAAVAADFEKKYGKKVANQQDLRKVYDDKNIDAVSVATPNHWHALAAIWACQAGKDVYLEKPTSHDFNEGQKVIAAAKKYNRIVQHGVQRRSSEAVQEAVKHLREGLIGNVYMARGINYKWRPSLGKLETGPIPNGLDWNLWQGPAEARQFSKNYVHYNWHWHWNYGNGEIGNQGVHELDMALWGMDLGFPEEISSSGTKNYLWDDCRETPEVLTTTFNYPKQKKIIEFEVRPWMGNKEDMVDVGNIFYGDKGYMVVPNYDSYKTFLGRNREPGPERKAGGDHYENFVKAVIARDKNLQNGPIEQGHLAAGMAHLANISYRLGRKMNFDPKVEKFINDKEGNAMLGRKYRAPFVLPELV
jgi:predicted dehydrogenase